MTDGVDVATAHAVHPSRPWWMATPDDLCTRERGIDIRSRAGTPVPVAIGAGDDPRGGHGITEVRAASATAVLLRRDPVARAGGLHGAISDVDAAMIDLCLRLSAEGSRLVAVDDAVIQDPRPVTTRGRLRTPVEPGSASWRTVVERHGPALLSKTGRPSWSMRFAVTTAVPSAKLVERWGDWHFASAMARALTSLGHEVRLQTADQADDLAGRTCDVHVVLRGLQAVRRTPGQRHILWVVSHPESVTTAECDEADLVCVASERFAASLRRRTRTPVAVLLQATDHRRFRPVPPAPEHQHHVTVVAKSRERVRVGVATALEAGVRPAIYGSGWQGLVHPDLVVAEYVSNDELPTVYCSAGVVLNDHWGTMRASGFVSNRIFDVLACGVPVVSDHMDEIADLFGDAVPTYRSASELRAAVDAALEDPDDARARAVRGREAVLDSHTFDHRARELLDHVAALPARWAER